MNNDEITPSEVSWCPQDLIAKLKREILEANQELGESGSEIPVSSVLTFFRELGLVISPESIEETIELFSEGCNVLEKKIYLLEALISLQDRTQVIWQFLENKDWGVSYEKYLRPNLTEPVKIPALSLQYLAKSLSLLEKSTRSSRNLESSPVEKATFSLDLSQPNQLFEDRKDAFLDSLRSKLPNSLTKILGKTRSKDEYFEQFSFVLHLIQEGRLFLKKNQTDGISDKGYFLYLTGGTRER